MDLPVLHQLGIAVGLGLIGGVANVVQVRSTEREPGMTTEREPGMTTEVAGLGILFPWPG
jgi:hypothetical protein